MYPDEEFNFFSNQAFQPLKNTCDSVFDRLHSKGLGAKTKAVPVLTAESEATLWSTKVMNMDTPKRLLKAYTYISTKAFYHMVAIYFIICNALKQVFIQICSVHVILCIMILIIPLQVHTVVVAHMQ